MVFLLSNSVMVNELKKKYLTISYFVCDSYLLNVQILRAIKVNESVYIA